MLRIQGSKKAEVTGRRKLYTVKVHTLYSRQKCIGVINSGRIDEQGF
jgi:hypothetical protein